MFHCCIILFHLPRLSVLLTCIYALEGFPPPPQHFHTSLLLLRAHACTFPLWTPSLSLIHCAILDSAEATRRGAVLKMFFKTFLWRIFINAEGAEINQWCEKFMSNFLLRLSSVVINEYASRRVEGVKMILMSGIFAGENKTLPTYLNNCCRYTEHQLKRGRRSLWWIKEVAACWCYQNKWSHSQPRENTI